MDDEVMTVVIDNGSLYMKAGLSGEDWPKSVFQTRIGTIENTEFIGEALDSKNEQGFKNPIDRGIITDWDSMEKIWHYIFANELKLSPKEGPLLMTEVPLNPKANRELTTQIMFETFQVPAMYLAVQAVLSLYASGRTTGVVLESGDGVTNIVLIYEGSYFRHLANRLDLGGKDLTDHLTRLLEKCGYPVNSAVYTRKVLMQIKERVADVTLELRSEQITQSCGNMTDIAYELPDGEIVNVGIERYICTEALFQPSIMGVEGKEGIHELLYKTLTNCDLELKKEMYNNVVLSGGNTMFPGLRDRLRKEVDQLSPSFLVTKVIVPPERKMSCWIGGSILGSLSIFHQLAMTKGEYEEFGPILVHRKCMN